MFLPVKNLTFSPNYLSFGAQGGVQPVIEPEF
jgi:hypothetical protein